MPGYIIHLTAAKLWIEQKKQANSKEWMEKFFIGNLLPDAVTDKNKTHFRDPRTQGNRVQYPELEAFLKATKNCERTPFWWGFYYHLYIDACFFKEYMPKIVTFLDKNDKEEQKIDYIVKAKVHKSGRYISQQEFFSEAYYYGDFTKMNEILKKKFQIDFDWHCQQELPDFWRMRVERQIAELKEFMKQSRETESEFMVFDLKDLIVFLKKKVEEFPYL